MEATEFKITEAAIEKIRQITKDEGENAMLRVSVTSGGCSGFQYNYLIDTNVSLDDVVFDYGGAKIVVDEISLNFIKGAELDHTDELMGSYFSIKNPIAKTGCGCGSSFSV